MRPRNAGGLLQLQLLRLARPVSVLSSPRRLCGVLPVWGIKVNFGAVATEFSDDYSGTALEASITEQSLAIIDLENQKSIAADEVLANALGGLPTLLRLISSSAGG